MQRAFQRRLKSLCIVSLQLVWLWHLIWKCVDHTTLDLHKALIFANTWLSSSPSLPLPVSYWGSRWERVLPVLPFQTVAAAAAAAVAQGFPALPQWHCPLRTNLRTVSWSSALLYQPTCLITQAPFTRIERSAPSIQQNPASHQSLRDFLVARLNRFWSHINSEMSVDFNIA